MIRVIVELVPHGQEEFKRTINVLEIANTGKGNSEVGDYKWRWWGEKLSGTPTARSWTSGSLPMSAQLASGEGITHIRSHGVEDLVCIVLEDLITNRERG